MHKYVKILLKYSCKCTSLWRDCQSIRLSSDSGSEFVLRFLDSSLGCSATNISCGCSSVPPTDVGVLSEDERRHEVPPHPRRLKHEEEDAEVLIDDVGALLALAGSLQVSRDGQVGAFSRPQRRAPQTQDHWGGDQGVPVWHSGGGDTGGQTLLIEI